MSTMVLRELAMSDELALRKAVEEFAAHDPDWEFAFRFGVDTDFPAYVRSLHRQRDGIDLPDGWIPHTFYVADLDGAIVGRLSLRHRLNEFLLGFGGHIGFGVVPSHRGQGLATEMLRQALPRARQLGIERLLLTCDETNITSSRVIQKCGGQLEDKRPRDDGAVTCRYWIELSGSEP